MLNAKQKTKSTPAGDIPVDWECVKLGHVTTCFSGGTPSRSNPSFYGGNIPWIKSGELNAKKVLFTSEHITSEALKKSAAKMVEPGTTLLAMYGATAGVIARTTIAAAINQAILAVVPNEKKIDPDFLEFSLVHISQKLLKLVQGAQPNLNAQMIKNSWITLPPIEKQQKIAIILGSWDSSIDKLDKLTKAKIKRKKSLSQQLLSGRKRLRGFDKEWKTVSLGDVVKNQSKANKGKLSSDSLYGVTKAKGIVPMREQVKGNNQSHCKILQKNWFAYNPMRINIGSIAKWEQDETIMVSGDYVVFSCNEEKLLPDYLDQVRKTSRWDYFMTVAGNGSVRIRIYFKDLAGFTFKLPPINEQKAIAQVLQSAETEIALLKKQKALLTKQKQGLMQQLLTGKIRNY